MLPTFLPKSCVLIDVASLAFKIWKCCSFRSNSLFIQFDVLAFQVRNRGKCCPFFSQTIFIQIDVSGFHIQSKGTCCPFCFKNVIIQIDVLIVRNRKTCCRCFSKMFSVVVGFQGRFKTGEMLFIILLFFIQIDVLGFQLQNSGTCCPILSAIVSSKSMSYSLGFPPGAFHRWGLDLCKRGKQTKERKGG